MVTHIAGSGCRCEVLLLHLYTRMAAPLSSAGASHLARTDVAVTCRQHRRYSITGVYFDGASQAGRCAPCALTPTAQCCGSIGPTQAGALPAGRQVS